MQRTIKGWMVLLLMLGGNAMAQSQSRGFFKPDDERTFYGGATLGANFSTVNGDGYGGYRKVGLTGGGIVAIRVLPKLLTSVELLYSQKGSRGVAETNSIYSGPGFDKYYLNLNYVEIPLMVQYVMNDLFRLGVGASYAQLLNSKEEIITAQYNVKDKPGNEFRKQDYNFILGGGVQFGSGIFLEGRYQFSLASIRDANKVPYYYQYIGGQASQFNSLFTFKIMYLIK